MTDKSETYSLPIVLAGKTFKITCPFTLAQAENLKIAVVLPRSEDPQEEVKRETQRNIEVLVAALQPEHPDITADVLRSMRIRDSELSKAIIAIMRESEMLPEEEAADADKAGAAGEAKAEAAAA